MTEMLDRTRPPAPGAPRELPFPAFDRISVRPGLELLVAPIEQTSLVALELVTRGGGQHDPPNLPGVASFAANLLDQGTEQSSAFEIASRAESLGASLAVSADWDTTTIDLQGLEKDLPDLLELLAEVALRPSFPEAEIERTRGRRLTELLRRRTQPSAIASERFVAEVYGEQPYGYPLLGTEEGVRATRREDLEAFYRGFVRSGGATLVAAGRLRPQELERAVRDLFADWPEGSAPPDPPIHPPEIDALRTVIVDRAGPQSELRVGHASVPRSHPDRTALVVLASLLGGKFTSRLNLELREKHGVTYGIRSRFSARRGPGPFHVSSSVATTGVGLATRTILDELRRLREEPVSDAELEDTKRYLVGVFPYTLQSAHDVVQRLAQIPIHDLPDDHYDGYRERIEAVTAEELRRVAREHLHPDRAVVVVVGPEDELEGQLG